MRRTLTMLATAGLCFGAAPVVALAMVGAPLAQTLSVADQLGDRLGKQLDEGDSAPLNQPAATRASAASTDAGAALQLASEKPPSKTFPPPPSATSAATHEQSTSSATQEPKSLIGTPTAGTADVPFTPPPLLRARRDAPRCDNTHVYIVTDTAEGGMATIATGDHTRGRPRRIGNRIAGYDVIAIDSLGYGRGPAVWLSKGKTVCQVALFDDNPIRERKRVTKKTRKKSKSSKRKSRKRNSTKRARRR